MREQDKTHRNFYIIVFLLAIVSVAYSLIKVAAANWNIMSLSTRDLTTISIMFFVGLFMLHLPLRHLLSKNSRKNIELDERIVKVFNNSLRNAGIAMMIGVFGAVFYFSIFNNRDELLFSINSIQWITFPTILVFLISYLHYQKSKNL